MVDEVDPNVRRFVRGEQAGKFDAVTLLGYLAQYEAALARAEAKIVRLRERIGERTGQCTGCGIDEDDVGFIMAGCPVHDMGSNV